LRRADPTTWGNPPFAEEGRLAYVAPPSLAEDFGTDAACYFKNLVWERPLVATIEGVENGRSLLVIGDPAESVLVNASLVRMGFAQVLSRNSKAQVVLGKLKTAEDQARKAHLNIWRFGDLPDPDLDEPEVPGLAARIKK
jgi:endonuclease YncB( thermonuclease family)